MITVENLNVTFGRDADLVTAVSDFNLTVAPRSRSGWSANRAPEKPRFCAP